MNTPKYDEALRASDFEYTNKPDNTHISPSALDEKETQWFEDLTFMQRCDIIDNLTDIDIDSDFLNHTAEDEYAIATPLFERDDRKTPHDMATERQKKRNAETALLRKYQAGRKKRKERKNKPNKYLHPSAYKRSAQNAILAEDVQEFEIYGTLNHNYDRLLLFIDENNANPYHLPLDCEYKAHVSQQIIHEYNQESDPLKQLHLLGSLSIPEGIACIQSGKNTHAQKYLLKRLEFYNDLYLSATIHNQNNRDEVQPEGIRIGLQTDIWRAAMKGTPELQAYECALSKCNIRELPTCHLPRLQGYHAYINSYDLLRDVYREAWTSSIQHAKRNYTQLHPCIFDTLERFNNSYNHKKEDGEYTHPNLTELWEKCFYQSVDNIKNEETQQLFHEAEKFFYKLERKAKIIASEWIVQSSTYNDMNRGPESPYVSSYKEAFTWAQLGAPKSLQGMRQKICDVNLNHIDRFRGKVHPNRYAKKRYETIQQLSEAKDLADQNTPQKRTFIENYKRDQIKTLSDSFQKQLEKLTNKKEKTIQNLDPHHPEYKEIRKTKKELFAQKKSELHSKYIQQIQHIQSLNIESIIQELSDEKDSIEKKFKNNKNLLEKAIDLTFQYAEFEEVHINSYSQYTIDWINKAYFGLINWTYKALQAGVSKEMAFGYARVLYFFPECEDLKNDKDFIKNIGSISKTDLEDFMSLLYHFEVDKNNTKDVKIIMKDYKKSPWIQTIPRECNVSHTYPFNKKQKNKEAWCAQNAVYKPHDWNKAMLGKIIYRRLEQGIDASLHDATYWLKDFETPKQNEDCIYKDTHKEMDLIYSFINIPAQQRKRVSHNAKKNKDLFSDIVLFTIYQTAIELSNQDFSDPREYFESIISHIEDTVYEENNQNDTMESNKKSILQASHIDSLHNYAETIAQSLMQSREVKKITPLITELRNIGIRRKEYATDAQKWINQHSSTPRDTLVYAWKNRTMALSFGCDDNPRAIKQWADVNALHASYVSMKDRGTLPHNFTMKDLHDYAQWATELVRCYDGKTTIQTIAGFKAIHEKDPFHQKVLPPAKINLGDGWHAEILAYDDPRGCTIGKDTGCCMTIGGEASSCIKAGYEREDCGFMALYRDEKIVSQSFIWVNQREEASTLVCDNVEANQGRDASQIRDRYLQFFDHYIKEQWAKSPDFDIHTVHVGTQYSDMDLNGLSDAQAIQKPADFYSDSENQKTLLTISQKELDRIKKRNEPSFTYAEWADICPQIMHIENAAFEGKGYSQELLEKEFTQPGSIAVVIHNEENDIIGYTTAWPTNKNTLYVSSTAILPKYQGQGKVRELMSQLDTIAQERGYTQYERDCRSDNGYADAIEKHYTVIHKGQDVQTSHGMQRRLCVKVPDRE